MKYIFKKNTTKNYFNNTMLILYNMKKLLNNYFYNFQKLINLPLKDFNKAMHEKSYYSSNWIISFYFLYF